MSIKQLLLCIFALLIISTICPPNVSADFLDDAPYWFWASSWEGELTVEYKQTFKQNLPNVGHQAEERSSMELEAAVFTDRLLKKDLVWYQSSSNALVNYWLKENFTGAGSEEYLEAFRVDKGEVNSTVDQDSKIYLDFDNQTFSIILDLPLELEIPLTRTAHLFMEVYDEEKTIWQMEKDDTYNESKLPTIRGWVEDKEFPERGKGLSGVEDMSSSPDTIYNFHYDLQPVYDESEWLEEYKEILQRERQSYLNMWENILDNCDCDGSSCIVCRAADRSINKTNSWINVLAEDGIRVCRALVDGEVPGLLSLMESHYTKSIPRYIKRGPADTCKIIHRYLYTFFDSKATDSNDSIYNRLPVEMKQLYSRDTLKHLSENF
ncbi:MAG: hypothetical protein ACOCRZ_07610 [Halothermotrichaceae bacterium]